jgi:ATP-dependent Clp protease protease subunit
MYQADQKTGEIFLYDAIGPAEWGMIDAATVLPDMAKMHGRRVTLRISSPGGSVEEGRLIYNAAKRHNGGVDVVVDSSAYSIASYIAMAGERIVMAKNAMMMLHNPLTMAIGNADELRRTADMLDKYRDSVLDAYTEKSKKDRTMVKIILDAETWYTANEAVSAGFATEVGDIVIDAPKFPRAIYEPKASDSSDHGPYAGSRTPASMPSREIRLQQIKAMFGR